jgi:hypothetical protein
MLKNMSMTGRSGSIIVASCATEAEAWASIRWVLPVLNEWPHQAWAMWLCDSRRCDDARAALIEGPDALPQWTAVDAGDFDADGDICKILAGKMGIVILTHDTIASQALRALEGLVSGLICIATSDPLAKPFKRSFASLGVTAGI